VDSRTISPKKGENQSLSISAMKGETHSAKETADAQGETDDEDDELPRLIPRGTPGYESGDESDIGNGSIPHHDFLKHIIHN
jgi:hypothetical protein